MTESDDKRWAYGCHQCTYGVRNEYYTPPTGAVELLLERLVNAERVGPAYFCECRAGKALRGHLATTRKRYMALTTRFGGDDVRIGEIVLSDARAVMSKPHVQYGRKLPSEATPTMRFVGIPQPQEREKEPTP